MRRWADTSFRGASFRGDGATGEVRTVLAATLVLVAALAVVVSSAVGASAPLPGTQTTSDRAAWRRLLHWPGACETSWRLGGSGAGIAGVWPLARGRFLVAVDCTLGAYQGTSMLYLLDSDRHVSRPIALHIYQDQGAGVPRPTSTTVVLGTLSTTVSALGGQVSGLITTLGTDPTGLNSSVLNGLQTQVTGVQNGLAGLTTTVTGQGTQLTALQGTVNTITGTTIPALTSKVNTVCTTWRTLLSGTSLSVLNLLAIPTQIGTTTLPVLPGC